jgi:predicted PurR-regulated permease PerM
MGCVGMMLAVPILAIFNQIFSHVKTLNPLCYLLSKNDGIEYKK